jgi:predicted dinucleotide-binding enzyme
MKLAIIGAGNVGGTLGTAWVQKAGHDIFFGVTNPQSDKTQAPAWRQGRRRDGNGSGGLRRHDRTDDAVDRCRGRDSLHG